MSKEKKRKPAEGKDKEGLVYFEIWGILLILFSFILISELGPVGSSLNRLVQILFGDFYWLTLIFLIYYGVMMIISHQFITYSSLKLKGIIFISLSLLMFSHYPIYNFVKSDLNESSSNLVVLSYNLYMSYIEHNNTSAVFGGGVIGASVLTVIIMLVGEVGSKVIAGILFAAGIAFLFEKTVYDFFDDLFLGTKNVSTGVAKKVTNVYGRMREVSLESKSHKNKHLEQDTIEVEEAPNGSKPFIHVKSDNIPYEKPGYKKPNMKELQYHDNAKVLEKQKDITLNNAKIINAFFKEHVISTQIDEIYIGPSISTYIVKIKSISQKNSIMNNISQLYSQVGTNKIRVYDEYYDQQLLKIEIPNEYCYLISLREVLDEHETNGLILGRDYKGEFCKLQFTNSFNLLTIGNDISSKIDFLKMIVLQIIYQFTPEECSLVLCDSTKFELNEFSQIEHLYSDFIDDVKNAKQTFIKLYTEMEYRLNGHREHKPILVIINDITDFYIDDYRKYINYMIMYGPKVNIYLICSTINLDESILNVNFRSMFENIIAFQIKNKELSKKFADIETDKLLKDGDCILSEKNERRFSRIQLITLDESDYNFL